MALEVSNLRVEHDGKALIDGLSMTFEPGTLVGLVGPNGAGKTTLLRHLAGLRTPRAGHVTLDGQRVLALPAQTRGRLIGYVPQYFEPAWDFTVLEIVELGASRAGGAGARIDSVIGDHELEPLRDRRWSRLSGGERARALLAAVLVAEPTVLLADEPGAGLDIRHRLELLHRLHAIAHNRILVVVMHDLEAALRYCDRVVVLAQGRVVIDDTPDVVLADPRLDETFHVSFQRVAIDSAGGPLLPAPRR
ncbi:MAG: ABC transporter ATP-binding protein [Vicinamibacterales bacterium]